jgi:hypothetical protein
MIETPTKKVDSLNERLENLLGSFSEPEYGCAMALTVTSLLLTLWFAFYNPDHLV